MLKKILCILFLCAILNCSKNSTGPDQSNYEPAFLKVWNDFDQNYSYFVHKKVNWDSVKTVYQPVAQQTFEYELFIYHVLKEMLTELKDLHVNLYDKNGTSIPLFQNHVDNNYNYDQSIFNKYVTISSRTTNELFYFGIVSEDIAYIRINTWNYTYNQDVIEFQEIFENYKDYYNNYKGLIIDVRNNAGGSDGLAKDVAGRFTTETHIYAYYQYRNGPDHNDFTPLQPVSFSPSGSWQFKKPVALLIGERCMSSNESFILMMSTLDHVTTIGDTTRGSSGRPVEFYLDDGTKYTISSFVAYKADKTVLEDAGIIPDITIDASESITDGRDWVLEKAIEALSQ